MGNWFSITEKDFDQKCRIKYPVEKMESLEKEIEKLKEEISECRNIGRECEEQNVECAEKSTFDRRLVADVKRYSSRRSYQPDQTPKIRELLNQNSRINIDLFQRKWEDYMRRIIQPLLGYDKLYAKVYEIDPAMGKSEYLVLPNIREKFINLVVDKTREKFEFSILIKYDKNLTFYLPLNGVPIFEGRDIKVILPSEKVLENNLALSNEEMGIYGRYILQRYLEPDYEKVPIENFLTRFSLFMPTKDNIVFYYNQIVLSSDVFTTSPFRRREEST